MSRFVDGYTFAPDPPAGSPPTLSLLLIRLGVSFAPESEQRAAVVEWMRSNTPRPRLLAEVNSRYHLSA